jgi:hypothetical protein
MRNNKGGKTTSEEIPNILPINTYDNSSEFLLNNETRKKKKQPGDGPLGDLPQISAHRVKAWANEEAEEFKEESDEERGTPYQ